MRARVVAVTPCGRPDAILCAAASMAGALGVLDLGVGDRRALEQLALAADTASGRSIGVRVAADCNASIADLSAALGEVALDVVVLGPGSPWTVTQANQRWAVLAEVTSVGQARAAVAAGAAGLIARGAESGGRVGELGSFVLLQQLLADPDVTVPVWACGGIGPATAAAAVAGGAAGVVLDTQLALMPECSLPESARAQIALSDGTGTRLADGRRTLGPADLPAGQDSFLASRFVERYGTTARAVRAIEDAIDAASRRRGGRGRTRLGVCPRAGHRASRRAGADDQGQRPGRVRRAPSPTRAGCRSSRSPCPRASRPGRCSNEAERRARATGRGASACSVSPRRRSAPRSCEAIREFRPAVRDHRGRPPGPGRPRWRTAGIATFLHVPSPGLLRQFLAGGRAQVRVRGRGVRRPRRTALQLLPVGGRRSTSCRTSSTASRRRRRAARALRRRHPRRALGGDGRRRWPRR